MKNFWSVIVYSDVHHPYANPAAVELFRIMAQAVTPRPARVVCLGDYLDNYAVSSRYGKDPRREARYQKEIDIAAANLVVDRALFPDIPFDFIGGNHERRTKLYVGANARALHDLRNLAIDELLGMAKLGITFHDQPLRIGDMDYCHGDEELAGVVHPARTMYLKRHGSLIMGHVHRTDEYFNNMADGTVHQAYANPCLCKYSQEYVRGVPQWQTGFSKVLYYGTELLSVEQYLFIQKGGYLCSTMGGKLFRVRAGGSSVSWSHSS